jgi:hypothetical protein
MPKEKEYVVLTKQAYHIVNWGGLKSFKLEEIVKLWELGDELKVDFAVTKVRND